MSRGVLVVDDDPFIRKLIATTLEDVAEFELHEAADGAEALEVARRERPTLVFLDVDMPVLNGIDACRQLRSERADGPRDDRDADRRARRQRRAQRRGGRRGSVPDEAVQPARPAATGGPARRAAVRLVTFMAASGGARVGELQPDHTVVELAAPTMIDWLAGDGPGAERTDVPRSPTCGCWRPSPSRPSVRDFYAYEGHVAAGFRARGAKIPPAWYEMPVFYFSNPAAIYGPGAPITRPEGCERLDFELEIAAVIDGDGRDRRIHADERLERARHPAPRDDRRPRAGEGQGLRHQPRPVARDAGRARPTTASGSTCTRP